MQWGPCDAGKESEVLDKSLMSAEVERTRYKNEARPAAVVAVNASFSRPLLFYCFRLPNPSQSVSQDSCVYEVQLDSILSFSS